MSSSSTYDTLVHLVAGGLDPLEKQTCVSPSGTAMLRDRFFIYRSIRHIVETEGTKALFKGLGPNLIGVAPSRAIYFCTYSKVKAMCNENFPSPDSPPVHICSAAAAGFVCSTATNPIWFIKTRLQLDRNRYGTTTAWKCIRALYREAGFIGFYKGITASYFGISETIIHFVIYEFLKSKLQERNDQSQLSGSDGTGVSFFVQFMIAGAISKTFASVVAYPHEVARTRLREEGSKYRTFIQTMLLVWREEGRSGLYRGLGTQLVRQIPNTAIMMATYELIVCLLQSD